MIALLVIFTAIGLSGLLMLMAGAQLQATRVEALQRKADAALSKAEAMMADRADWPSHPRQQFRDRDKDPNEAF